MQTKLNNIRRAFGKTIRKLEDLEKDIDKQRVDVIADIILKEQAITDLTVKDASLFDTLQQTRTFRTNLLNLIEG